jgi:hypothetical protein
MYDAIVLAQEAEPAARTLSTLVEGAVEGLLNHVLLVSDRDSPDLAALADAAGCRCELSVAHDALAEALKRHLVTSHALAFAAGAVLPAGWPGRLRDELRRRGQPDAEMSLLFRPERRLEAWKLIAAVSLQGRMPLGYGALLPRARLIGGLKGGRVKSHGPMHLTEMTVGRV